MLIGLTTLLFSTVLAPDDVTPAIAMSRLFEGNKRFVSGKTLHGAGYTDNRKNVATGQNPFAVIIGCADSRVGPEILFDQGLGDIFVVRTAGNLVDVFGMASTEYAVDHLHANLVVVLGHEKCGAVQAAVDAFASEKAADTDTDHANEGHLMDLLEAIKPAVEATKGKEDRVEATVNENVKLMVRKLRTTAGPLKTHLGKGDIKIIGGRYDLDSGTVSFTEVE